GARGALGGRRVPCRRFAERDRKDRAVAVNHVQTEKQRDVEARLGNRDALGVAGRLRAGQVQEPADQTLAHLFELCGARLVVDRGQVELAQLFLQGHAGDERVDQAPGSGALRGSGAGRGRAQGNERHETAVLDAHRDSVDQRWKAETRCRESTRAHADLTNLTTRVITEATHSSGDRSMSRTLYGILALLSLALAGPTRGQTAPVRVTGTVTSAA